MSHSYRHIPIIGNCSNSDKPGKAKASRKLRAAERVVLATLNFNDLESMDGLIMPFCARSAMSGTSRRTASTT